MPAASSSCRNSGVVHPIDDLYLQEVVVAAEVSELIVAPLLAPVGYARRRRRVERPARLGVLEIFFSPETPFPDHPGCALLEHPVHFALFEHDPAMTPVALRNRAAELVHERRRMKRGSAATSVLLRSGFSGAEIARMVLARSGLEGVRLEESEGWLVDHYDPSTPTLRLSPKTFEGPLRRRGGDRRL
jgi:hypothetical protein